MSSRVGGRWRIHPLPHRVAQKTFDFHFCFVFVFVSVLDFVLVFLIDFLVYRILKLFLTLFLFCFLFLTLFFGLSCVFVLFYFSFTDRTWRSMAPHQPYHAASRMHPLPHTAAHTPGRNKRNVTKDRKVKKSPEKSKVKLEKSRSGPVGPFPAGMAVGRMDAPASAWWASGAEAA